MTKRKPKPEAAQVPAPTELKREPTKLEAEAIAKAAEFCRSRTQPLAYEVDTVEGGVMRVKIPHSNAGGFFALQRATFGTVSAEFAELGTAQAGNIARDRRRAAPTQDEMNFALAAVAAVEPQNEIEAMLAIQMLGTHSVAMEMLDRAKSATTTDHLERFNTAAVKLLRTYTAQVEALAKLKRGGSQKVVVEHVHIHAGAQAVVGNVSTGAPGGGVRIGNGHQPHELTGPAALALQASPEMLCEDAGRDLVHGASDGREDPVPQARRRQGKRRTHG